MALTDRERELHRLAMARYRAKHPERETARWKKWQAENREKCVAAQSRWKAKDPERARAIERERALARKARDPERFLSQARERTRIYREKNPLCHVKKFGITPKKYEDLMALQNGLCAICHRPERALQHGRLRRLSVDHCHDTGVIRGLLCRDCNFAIGKLNNSPVELRRAADYLESASKD